MYNRYQMVVLTVCLVLSTTGFIGAFSTPVANTIIVSFDDTQAERAAIEVLKDQFPDALVVDYGGAQYNSLKMRSIGPMVFVGHGNDQGIKGNDGFLTKEKLTREIELCTSPKIMLLACESKSIAEQDKTGRTFGFGSIIDAELAALEVAIRISVSQMKIDSALGILDEFLTLASSKISGDKKILPLPVVFDPGAGGGGSSHVFSNAEIWNAVRIFVLGCVFALVGFAISTAINKLRESLEQVINIFVCGAEPITKMNSVFSIIKSAGIGAIGQAVKNVYGGYLDMAKAWLHITVDVLSDWIDRLSAGEWAIFIGICALELVVIILTAGAEAEVRLYAGISLAAVTAGTIAIADALDSDSVPCKSILEACGTFLD